MNRIYCFVYSFIQKTPSRDMPHEMTAMFIATMIIMHAISALMIFGLLTKNYGLFSENVTISIVVSLIASFIISVFYYVTKKNGVRIMRKFGEKSESKLSIFIGAAISIETLCLPLLIAGCVVLKYKS